MEYKVYDKSENTKLIRGCLQMTNEALGFLGVKPWGSLLIISTLTSPISVVFLPASWATNKFIIIFQRKCFLNDLVETSDIYNQSSCTIVG